MCGAEQQSADEGAALKLIVFGSSTARSTSTPQEPCRAPSPCGETEGTRCGRRPGRCRPAAARAAAAAGAHEPTATDGPQRAPQPRARKLLPPPLPLPPQASCCTRRRRYGKASDMWPCGAIFSRCSWAEPPPGKLTSDPLTHPRRRCRSSSRCSRASHSSTSTPSTVHRPTFWASAVHRTGPPPV